MFSLRIITIFYHLRTIRVNQRNHIALQIVDIEVIDAVIGNHAGLALRIIEEYEEENPMKKAATRLYSCLLC